MTPFFRSVYVYLFIFFVLGAVCTAYYFSRTATTQEITIGTEPFVAWVADTPHLRELGLSGKERIRDTQAMLFVFDRDDIYTFWMKDMRFSIDILWLDVDKRVVAVASNISPDTYHKDAPETSQNFTSPIPARYVVELAGGATERLGIGMGTQAAW